MTEMTLDTMDRRILDIIHDGFPLESRPYAILRSVSASRSRRRLIV